MGRIFTRARSFLAVRTPRAKVRREGAKTETQDLFRALVHKHFGLRTSLHAYKLRIPKSF